MVSISHTGQHRPAQNVMRPTKQLNSRMQKAKAVTRQDKKTAEQQMKEIQEELRNMGIREGEDEDGEDS